LSGRDSRRSLPFATRTRCGALPIAYAEWLSWRGALLRGSDFANFRRQHPVTGVQLRYSIL
jgi:hypothetical protein